MQANIERANLFFQQNALAAGKPLEDFTDLARTFVYGGREVGRPDKVSKPQSKNMSKDPNYEVDPAEEANADDDCSDDDENPHNRVSQSKVNHIFKTCSLITCFLKKLITSSVFTRGDVRPTSQKKRCKTVVPPSQISTRSRAITDTEDDATEVDGHTEGLNGEEETTATMTLTTRDSSATNASIVISIEQQGMEKQVFKLTIASSLQSTILATYLLCTVSELLAKNVMEKRKRVDAEKLLTMD